MLKIGIDASNLSSGGGITHLVEFLDNVERSKHFDVEVCIWASAKTLSRLRDYDFMIKMNEPLLNKGFTARFFWQRYCLTKQLISYECDVLFAPGGSLPSNFRPAVTMCRNMLPFDLASLKLYGFSLAAIKLLLLRHVQMSSFKKADGLIFLSEYAFEEISKVCLTKACVELIPHAVNRRFLYKRKDISSQKREITKLLYVSHTEPYKHHVNVLKAFDILKSRGASIEITFVGRAGNQHKAFLEALSESRFKEYIKYQAELPYQSLQEQYQIADLGIFASSCENLPNTLLEMMASELPICCSDKRPMSDLLGDDAYYFNPFNPLSIVDAIETALEDEASWSGKAARVKKEIENYTWGDATEKTLIFLNKVRLSHH